jgi:hypothetical protein
LSAYINFFNPNCSFVTVNYYLNIKEKLLGLILFLTLIFSISYFSSEPLISLFLKPDLSYKFLTKNILSKFPYKKGTIQSGKMNALVGNHLTTRIISDSLFEELVKLVRLSQVPSLRTGIQKMPVEKVFPLFTSYSGDLKNFNECGTVGNVKNRPIGSPKFWFCHIGLADAGNLSAILLSARFLSVRAYLLKRCSSEESLLFIFPKEDIITYPNGTGAETPIISILPKIALFNTNFKTPQ